MRFQALTLCLVGSLAVAVAARADHMRGTSDPDSLGTVNGSARLGSMFDEDMQWVRHYDVIRPGQSYTPGRPLVFMEDRNYYAVDRDFPKLSYVADKVTQIVMNQRHEEAELRALAPRAQTAGWENIQTVYDFMASDHGRLADFGSSWLNRYGFPVPRAPSVTAAADMSPEQSIDHVISMHWDAFNQAIQQRQGEKSATVRGMLLWSAATALRHISLLQDLDRDVDFGRRTVSALLRSEMEPGYMAENRTALMERIYREEYEIARITDTPSTTVATIQPTEIQHIVVQVPAPSETVATNQTETTTTTTAPAPAPAPSVTANSNVTPTERVLGRRQTSRTMRVRHRRAAK